MQSMTGYVEKKFNYRTFSLRISIKSLNHRFLDWNCRGGHIKDLENRLRTICQQELHRGRIEVYLNIEFNEAGQWEFKVNEAMFSEIIMSLDNISSQLDKKVSFSLDNLFNIPHLSELKRKDFTPEEAEFIEKSFIKVLADLAKVRLREGRELKKQIQAHIINIRVAIRHLEKLARKQPALIRRKLYDRLKELGSSTAVSEEKILEEAAMLAQKYDLTEEIERSKSHLKYFLELLSPSITEPVGKKMDFVAQELFREANTINSKAQDIAIIKESLTIKSELECIRQQVQNLE